MGSVKALEQAPLIVGGAAFAIAMASVWVAPAFIPFGGMAAAAAALALHVRTGRRRGMTLDANASKVGTLIESGRKLVIYERETGLFAHWYVALRGDEECDRAGRYEHEMSLLLVGPAGPEDAWAVQEALADWIRRNTRATDIAGYLGNGRFVVVMPETGESGAIELVRRVTDSVAGADWAISTFPADGASFEHMYAAAAQRLIPSDMARAA